MLFQFPYTVCSDRNDPGSEHKTWEEAAKVCRTLQAKGFPARIINKEKPSRFDPWENDREISDHYNPEYF